MRRSCDDLICGSKRGFAFGEALQLLIVLVIFAVLSIVIYRAFTDVNTSLQADSSLSTDAKATIDDLHDRYPATFDGAFITILGLLFLAGLAASMFIDTHPIMLVVVLILMAFLMLAAAVMSNTWADFTSDSFISSFTASFPMTDWVLDHFMVVIGAIGLLYGGVIYFKQRV